METVKGQRTLQNRAILGILLMMLGLSLYPLSDALAKHLMGNFGVAQTTFLRAITRFVPLCIAMFFQGGPRQILYTNHYKSHLIRLSVNLFYTLAFMCALQLSSLTVVYTLSYSSPFFMIILSALVLKEKISKERWVAVAIGMIGVVLAMKPHSNLFESAAIIILVGTFLGAFNKILMRKLAATEHSLAIAIYPNIVMMLAMAPYLCLTGSWEPMPWTVWGIFAVLGVITAAGQYAIAQALRFAQGSVLAPIDYSTFFWVVALDYLWWHKTVEMHTVIGAAVIVASNFFILYCTRKEEAKRKAAALQIS